MLTACMCARARVRVHMLHALLVAWRLAKMPCSLPVVVELC